jgi:ABC-type branched-subunit amino acid transport system substrate-binding protein
VERAPGYCAAVWLTGLGGVVRRLLLSSILFAVVGVLSLRDIGPLHAEDTPQNHVKTLKQIKIGAVVDLTGPGAARGRLNLKGMEDYFRFVNETAFGIGGRKLSLAVVDTGTETAGIPKDVERMCTSKKVVMWAVWNASLGEKLKPIFVKHELPHLDATHCLNLHPPVSYTYLPFGSVTLDCDAILQYIEMTHKGSEPPKIGILTASDACGEAALNACKTYGESHRLHIVAVEQFTPGTRNLESPMLKLRKRGAQYILLWCAAPDAITALKAADRIRYPVPFFGNRTLMGTDFSASGRGLIRNRLDVSFPGCLPGDGSPGIHLIKVLMDRTKSVSRFQTAYWEGISIAAIMARAASESPPDTGQG